MFRGRPKKSIKNSNFDQNLRIFSDLKEKIIETVYPDYREHNAAVKEVILNHAEQFVKIKFQD